MFSCFHSCPVVLYAILYQICIRVFPKKSVTKSPPIQRFVRRLSIDPSDFRKWANKSSWTYVNNNHWPPTLRLGNGIGVHASSLTRNTHNTTKVRHISIYMYNLEPYLDNYTAYSIHIVCVALSIKDPPVHLERERTYSCCRMYEITADSTRARQGGWSA